MATPLAWSFVGVVPFVVDEFLDLGHHFSRVAFAIWLPWGDDYSWTCSSRGIPRALLASTALHALLAALLARAAAARVSAR